MAKLIKILLEAKDYEIAERIADDTKLRDEYYERYGIQLIIDVKGETI